MTKDARDCLAVSLIIIAFFFLIITIIAIVLLGIEAKAAPGVLPEPKESIYIPIDQFHEMKNAADYYDRSDSHYVTYDVQIRSNDRKILREHAENAAALQGWLYENEYFILPYPDRHIIENASKDFVGWLINSHASNAQPRETSEGELIKVKLDIKTTHDAHDGLVFAAVFAGLFGFCAFIWILLTAIVVIDIKVNRQ